MEIKIDKETAIAEMTHGMITSVGYLKTANWVSKLLGVAIESGDAEEIRIQAKNAADFLEVMALMCTETFGDDEEDP